MPPHVPSTLTTPAPAIVPYTPRFEASFAATTAATALPATCGTLSSSLPSRLELPPFPPGCVSAPP
ncbi:hypothetical protein [Actinacidiphila epipremni]|uniref:Uncharacterized protein n=1 Tax=Actinacidiphila epipremni TaxID=2053013 RepID=A0ABX0ZRZ0_9ACTN|nr:hypothetical protein [Actinacidiphila epipremni]NJP44519.1 hypothetical protein [Actinacidiphila epipremni]